MCFGKLRIQPLPYHKVYRNILFLLVQKLLEPLASSATQLTIFVNYFIQCSLDLQIIHNLTQHNFEAIFFLSSRIALQTTLSKLVPQEIIS